MVAEQNRCGGGGGMPGCAKAVVLVALTLVLTAPSSNTGVDAATCPTAALDLFQFSSTCPAYRTCDAALCACSSMPLMPSGQCILARSVATPALLLCMAEQRCVPAYTACLMALAEQRNNASNAACQSVSLGIHAAMLQAALSGYDGSTLKSNCEAHLCRVTNGTCGNYTARCLAAAPALVTPVASTANEVYAIRFLMQLSGTGFAEITGSQTMFTAFSDAVVADVAAYLGIPNTTIEVLSMVRTLAVDFAIKENSGFTVEQLFVAVPSARYGPTFGANMKHVYARVASDQMRVVSIIVTSTIPPKPTTPQPPGPPASISVAPRFGAVAFVVAALLAAAMLFSLVVTPG